MLCLSDKCVIFLYIAGNVAPHLVLCPIQWTDRNKVYLDTFIVPKYTVSSSVTMVFSISHYRMSQIAPVFPCFVFHFQQKINHKSCDFLVFQLKGKNLG